jgi:hypothetical protein
VGGAASRPNQGISVIFIHTGMHKAGSTTLQSFMARNVEELEGAGVFYPTTGRVGIAHHLLARAIEGAGHATPLWQQLLDTYDRIPSGARLVLSSEAFESVAPRVLRAACGDRDVRIIMYARDTLSRIPSAYAQETKYGLNTEDFDGYFERIRPFVRPKWLYAHYLQPWIAAFGGENIRIRSTDFASLGGKSLIEDFSEVLGLGLAGITGTGRPGRDMNVTPGWKVVEALRAINCRTALPASSAEKRKDSRIWRHLVRLFEEGNRVGVELGWTDKGRHLTLPQIERLAEVYNEQAAKIRVMGIDARVAPVDPGRESGREFLPSADHIPSAELTSFLLQLVPAMSRPLTERVQAGSDPALHAAA